MDRSASRGSGEAPESIILIQWYVRATHHGVDVQSVRHITGSTYKRATHHGVGVRENEQAVKNDGASVTFQNGMWSETIT